MKAQVSECAHLQYTSLAIISYSVFLFANTSFFSCCIFFFYFNV